MGEVLFLVVPANWESKAPVHQHLQVRPGRIAVCDRFNERRRHERQFRQARDIAFGGWEFVVVDQRDGTRVLLKIRDTPAIGGYLVLLKRKLK
jgi:hypothetical protein